jgi:alpha-glucosidase (family GH31 glycosyl hydrolase)
MKTKNIKSQKHIIFTLLAGMIFLCSFVSASDSHPVSGAKKMNPTTIEVILTDNNRLLFDFYGDNIFRLFQDNSGGAVRNPEARPEAKMLIDSPRKNISGLSVEDSDSEIVITTEKMAIRINKRSGLMKISNSKTNHVVLEQIEPVLFEKEKVTLTFKENPSEYFYGGGVQNGRFSHKGKAVFIENQNSWTDGGVASPAPFYWSNYGYAIFWHTFKKGKYDFGAKEKGIVRLYHESDYLDVFVMINDGAVALLNDYYQLTGNPVLLPKFGFYEGHLNAYNRDYWKEDETGILFEDGVRYRESQKDNGGIKESLNGGEDNYQFSARAVIDRYKRHDMPLGWLLPNDGYGAGYGQTETLDGNIRNLKSLGDYARKNGVEIGLWTQSDLHPKPEISALLQRDIVKEVRDAGVRVLKTDVAWVGAGYSFGLNGIADVANIMRYYGNNSRPFIISLDGWAGSQRYAAIWSGDQTGGLWEYIRFHIPTYIGSGLSGIPNITSDMDGIFGGKNPVVNIRDFQWKTFTPMQLNMDGWGSNEKYPHALGEPATSINRRYLKLKSELIPYTYSIAKESVTGLPMMRAMFLEYPNRYTNGKSTQYQYLYGPFFLVAPVFQSVKPDEQGNDIRNNIYLPEGVWIDYFSGDLYEGNRILNNFDAPLWKLPVWVKNGAIIPMTNPNNNVSEIDPAIRIYEVYPSGYSSFTEYDDDGVSEEYRSGKGVTALIESNVNAGGIATVTVHPTVGDFTGFVKEKSTQFKINVTEKPKKVSVKIGKKNVNPTEVHSLSEYNAKDNVFFYDAAPNLNQFATKGSDFEKEAITKNPQLLVKVESVNTTVSPVRLSVEGFVFNPADKYRMSSGDLNVPSQAGVTEENTEAYTLKPTWDKVNNADFYEIDFEDMLYSTIQDTGLLFEGLEADTVYTFKLRAVNKDGYSDWTEFKATTKRNPLEFAIQGLTGEATAETQGGSGLRRLFDFEEGEMWHTRYNVEAVPFDLIIDLRTINQLDKFHYLPRVGGKNGMFVKGDVYYSNDKDDWKEAGSFEWDKTEDVKVFVFDRHPTARYIKIRLTEGVGNYGSGREMYVFKVPGTESYLPGDINNDRMIDNNDLTSYINYTGLRKGDADFDGYIGNGDMNSNGLIDAYDISVVTTQLEGGVVLGRRPEKLNASMELNTDKEVYKKGDTVEIHVKGKDLSSVNAFSFALPYDTRDYEFAGIQPINMKAMENLTYDRLHSNGRKSLYPTFVNIGNRETLEGDSELFIIKLKAKRNVKFELKAVDEIWVDKGLNMLKF